ncbi:MAG: DUF2630 family protein [Acidimicrobiales bacterium]
MDDADIRQHIKDLIATEHELRRRLAAGEITEDQEHEELRDAEEQLDQLWDLLRRRQAKREFGQDPDTIEPRPRDVVENYRQ